MKEEIKKIWIRVWTCLCMLISILFTSGARAAFASTVLEKSTMLQGWLSTTVWYNRRIDKAEIKGFNDLIERNENTIRSRVSTEALMGAK